VKIGIFSALGCYAADLVVFPIDTIATRSKINRTRFIPFKA